ncbi:MAG TPA: DUF2807 domain-containing protein [Dehalococcoidia bacterium]|nr:DUF2807 domain-containing protein [Dehalococcoidia bacterium]
MMKFLARIWAIFLWPFYLFPRLFVALFTRSLGVSRRPGPVDAGETKTKRVTQVLVVLAIIAASLAVVLFSKTRPPELGTSDFATDRRALPAFSQLFVSDDLWVEITVNPDADSTIEIFIDANLTSFVVADVVGDTLRVETLGEISQSLGSIIRIVTKSLESVTVNDGSRVEVFRVNTSDFVVDATDGSVVEVEGAAVTVDVRADGSRVSTRALSAAVATIAIDGDSIIDVFASTSISGSAGNQAEIRISGSPGEINIDADSGALVCQSTLPLDVPFTCIS